MAIGNFTVQSAIDELTGDSVFASLPLAKQIQIINSASQEFASAYNRSDKNDYADITLYGTPGVISGGSAQAGIALAVGAGGVAVTFSAAFTNSVLSSGDYVENVRAYRTEDGKLTEIGCHVDRAPGGLTLKPDFAADFIVWSAFPLTQ